jgi:hypothetical protein
MKILPLRHNNDVLVIFKEIEEAKRQVLKSRKPAHVIIDFDVRTSNEQRRAYRMILAHIAKMARPDGQEFTTNSWDRTFAAKFLGVEPGLNGPVSLSSSNLNLDQFSKYVKDIITFCRESLNIKFEGLEI